MLRTSKGGRGHNAHTLAPASWWFAAGVVLLEIVLALAGQATLGLAAAALLAPGFALAGLLPRNLRDHPLARITLAPALGLAASSIALISVSQIGVPLTGVSVRVTILLLVVAGLAIPRTAATREDSTADAPGPRAVVDEPVEDEASVSASPATATGWRDHVAPVLLDLVVLAAVLTVSVVLAWRVIGDVPVPGDDWAKYLLYADEIRHQGKLLLTNDLWMGGRPFSEDPGVPSLEGAALLMTGAPAGALVRTIVVLCLIQLAVVFGATRAWFGLLPAAGATLLLAIVPASQNILGWHGLANAGALAILALVLVQVGSWLAGNLDRRAQIGLAITIVGVVAAHRFTALFMFGMLGLSIGAAALASLRRAGPDGAARPAHGELFSAVAWTIAFAALIGLLVALDLRTRAGDSGGTLPYTSYLTTKIDLSLAIRDISPLLAGVAIATVVILTALRRLPREVWPPVAMALVAALLAYGWVFHLPLYYSRVTFFVPLPLAFIAAAGFGALNDALRRRTSAAPSRGATSDASTTQDASASTDPRGAGSGRAPATAVSVVLAAAMAFVFAGAWRQAEEVRDFYAFASTNALRALDALSTKLEPNEIVATDRCWSFLATWLLHTRTYPALEEQDIQPKAELVIARRSAAILHGTDEGRRLMRELPVRYGLLDPTCPVSGKRFAPPGTLVYAGGRLAIVQLDPTGKQPRIKGDAAAARQRARERDRLGG